MGEPYPHTLHLKALCLAAVAAHIAMVDIASHRPYYRCNSFKALQYGDITYVTCMPDLVATGEMDRIAVIPTGMSV